jgi:hypothetical protein
MNIPKYFAAKRTLHQKFICTPHHHTWSALLHRDILAIEQKQKQSLLKTYTTTYSEYLDYLIQTKQEEKLFLHNYYQGMHTLSGSDQLLSDSMLDFFGLESEYGKYGTLYQQELFRSKFVDKVQGWSSSQRLDCVLEMEVAKELMQEFIKETVY